MRHLFRHILQSTRSLAHLVVSCSLALAVVGCSSSVNHVSDANAQPDATLSVDARPSGIDAAQPAQLDRLLQALRADPQAALLAQSNAPGGWPAPVADGFLFVTTNPTLDRVAGEHDGWQGTPMQDDAGFRWVVLNVAAGDRYKFTNLTDWLADPWSRAYEWDGFGLMSMVAPAAAHRERFFEQHSANLGPRTVRVWRPAEPVTHLLYVHDGQNLFNPDAIWGGWHLDESAPAGMMIVGIDNTGARMDEYTHVADDIGSGAIGGLGDSYADMVENEIRSLIRTHYGEPARVGLMGSSLGGLISLHIAARFPDSYDFAASLSGTVGWGSIGPGIMNETVIEQYATAGHGSAVLYVDSGGNGTCVDSDGDGIMDDAADGADNYCENLQLRDVLVSAGYTEGVDMWHWWETDAPHNEAAWATRVWRPLGVFADL